MKYQILLSNGYSSFEFLAEENTFVEVDGTEYDTLEEPQEDLPAAIKAARKEELSELTSWEVVIQKATEDEDGSYTHETVEKHVIENE